MKSGGGALPPCGPSRREPPVSDTAVVLNPTTLTFTPHSAELLYRQSRFQRDLRIMRVTYILGVVLSSGYFLCDYLALGGFETKLLIIRLVIVNLVLLAGLTTTFIPALQRFAAHIGCVEFLLHVAFFAGINGAYDTPYVFAANGVITLGFLYLVWPVPFVTSCAYGVIGSLLYCGIVVAARPWSAELALLLLIFISMNSICIFAMYQAKYYRRAAFLNTLELDAERLRYRELLTSILPREVADRLQRGETVADLYDDVSVLFLDICNFTPIAARFPPIQVLAWLDRVFAAFDDLVDRHGLEKIKTIGDAYMVAGGFNAQQAGHLDNMLSLAVDMMTAAAAIPGPDGVPPQVRIGIHVGPVVAGVIGARRFLYDLWGDTVNTASRMESHGLPDTIQITDAVHARLAGRYDFARRSTIDVKGKGQMATWLLDTNTTIAGKPAA